MYRELLSKSYSRDIFCDPGAFNSCNGREKESTS